MKTVPNIAESIIPQKIANKIGNNLIKGELYFFVLLQIKLVNIGRNNTLQVKLESSERRNVLQIKLEMKNLRITNDTEVFI